MDSFGHHVAIFLIEPESRDATHLRRGILRNRGRHVIAPNMAKPIIDALSALDRDGAWCAEARRCFDRLLETLGGKSKPLPVRDERIDKVLAYIQTLPQKKVSLSELAAKAFLSENRFIHLFTEQVGIPPSGKLVKVSETIELGYGQCNTKAALLVALAKAVDLNVRLHFSTISKEIQHDDGDDNIRWCWCVRRCRRHGDHGCAGQSRS